MKKVVLIILILALCACPILFAACSNVSQRDLTMFSYVCSDDGYEFFSYDVYHEEAVVGEMSMKFEPLKNRSVTLPCLTDASGMKSFDGVYGTLFSIDLSMTNGDTITSRVVYDSDFTPIFSYKSTLIGGVKKDMQVSYEGKYLYTKLYVNGEESSSSRHKAAGCYDNEMLYALVRATAVDNSSYSLSFTAVNPLTASADGMTISKVGEVAESVKVLEPTEYTLPEGQTKYTTPCYQFRIATSNQYASTYSMTVAKARQTVKNDKIDITNVKKVIVTITEGEYKYILKDIQII